MPDFLTIVGRWWKATLGLMIAVMIVTGVALAFQKKLYVSTVTALPANSVAYDKGNIFNKNIQELYPAIGLADELDRVVGTAKLDTLYLTLVRENNLVEHYDIKPHPHAIYWAMERLKKNSSVAKSEYGELKIKMWDEDPTLAAAMANRFFDDLNALHQHLQSEGNAVVLRRLEEEYNAAKIRTDSSNIRTTSSTVIEAQQFENLIQEYRITVAAKPPVLLAVERARPGYYVDRPNRPVVLAVALFAALLLGILLAVILEKRER
ncbi:MAG: hypothetical protein JWP69_1131 [Flaviaesturariibacter sp.]|nr:hypothetical protein [Flaviaesturariibacter sp.]